MGVYTHAHGLIGAFDGRQHEAATTAAEYDGRDHHVQAVQTAGGQKARYRFGAAFDQNPTQAALG